MSAIGALNAYLSNLNRVARRNISDLMSNPADFERMTARRLDEDLTKQFSSPESGLDFVSPLAGIAGVIKNKGGQWLKPNVDPLENYRIHYAGATPEDRLVGLEFFRDAATASPDPTALVRLEKDIRDTVGDAAINKWLEGPYMKYVQRDMATPEDPLRALAEQGKLHFDPFEVAPYVVEPGFRLRTMREEGGFPVEGLGKSDMARQYEYLTDTAITQRPARTVKVTNPANAAGFRRFKNNPWVEKLEPETPTYEATELVPHNTGIPQLIEALQQGIHKADELPPNLRLTSERLQGMGIAKASSYAHDLKKYRAEQEMLRAIELSKNTPTFKAYDTGFSWKELTAPKQMWDEDPQVARKFVEDATKLEGELMNHCVGVGGYCDDIIDGKTRVFSLRDKPGRPHVTIEVTPVLEDGKLINEIMQIKGGSNSRPKDEYMPYVHDFVKNSGLQNPRIIYDREHTDFLDDFAVSRLREPYDLNFGPLGIDTRSVKFDVPEGYYTKGDIRQLLESQRPSEVNDNIWQGFMRRWQD
jgi:hypothetical protein